MTTTLNDVFNIPTDLTALEFVVRIRGGESTPQELVDEYVLTPGVRTELARILKVMKGTTGRGDDLGWFIHGSFGSGKSHFMAVLGYLLENKDFAWQKDDPHIGELAGQHRSWLSQRRLLVVRENMMSASVEGSRLDRMLYTAVNRELEERGHAPFEFLNVESVLEEARREGEQYGDQFWQNLAKAGIVGERADFEAVAGGSTEDRERLARMYLEYKGRDPSAAGFSPAWAEGLHRLARHVKDLGYHGLVFLIDEILLWLSGKTGPEYKEAINQLNVIIDHADGQRAVPMTAFVARQRRFSEFFPDMVDEEQLHDHLDHHAGRYELTTLEDVELRHIVKHRVLRSRDPAAVKAAVDRIAGEHAKVLPIVLQSADMGYVRDVFPFHPALIEMLIDVSSLLQRDRTALRLVYEMLMTNRDMPLGEFLPVGSAFDFVFPREGVVGSRRVEQLSAIRTLYFERLQPAINAMVKDESPEGFTSDRSRALEQLVKTALLGEVSPRLRGASGMTVERLVRLNDFEVAGHTDRGRMSVAGRDLVGLSQKAPSIQVSGSGGDAIVRAITDVPDFAEILARARRHVDNPARRFQTFHRVFQPLLGLDGLSGFGQGQSNDGRYTVRWRNTQRRGTVCIDNVRMLPYERFKVREGEFRVVIDYPWDEPGHTVEEDRQRIYAVRKAEGSTFTLCWLPRHLTKHELTTLHELSACEFVISTEGRDTLLGELSALDRQQVMDLTAERARTVRAEVQRALNVAYRDKGEVVSLVSDVDETIPDPNLDENLDCFARALLDRRYPQHPRFGIEPRPAELRTLLEWMLTAADAGDHRAPFDDSAQAALKGLGIPLEIVDLGQTRGRLRLDTRYIGEVLEQLAADEVLWAPIDMRLEEEYGLQPALRNLMLLFGSRMKSYRILHETTRDPVTDLQLDARARTGLLLERAPILEQAAWSRTRELGTALFGLSDPPGMRTLRAQDDWAARVQVEGGERRTDLRQLHDRLLNFVAQNSARLAETREAIDRLAAVDDTTLDSHGMLTALLEKWPADASDPLRAVVRGAGADLATVREIAGHAWDILGKSTEHKEHGAAANELRDDLRHQLAASQLHAKLARSDVQNWNKRAWELVNLIVGDDNGPVPPPPPGWKAHHLLERQAVPPGDEDGIATLLERIVTCAREAIEKHKDDAEEMALDVTLHVKSGGEES